jgi:hypothetical protein
VGCRANNVNSVLCIVDEVSRDGTCEPDSWPKFGEINRSEDFI